MKNLCLFLGLTLFGWIGWWVGEKVGFFTAYLLSGIASMAGIVVGWMVYRRFFD